MIYKYSITQIRLINDRNPTRSQKWNSIIYFLDKDCHHEIENNIDKMMANIR